MCHVYPSVGVKTPGRDDVYHYVSIGSDGPDGPRYVNLPVGILSPSDTQKDGSFVRDLLQDAQRITDPELKILLRPDQKSGP